MSDVDGNNVFNILIIKKENGLPNLSKIRQQNDELKFLNKNLKVTDYALRKIYFFYKNIHAEKTRY